MRGHVDRRDRGARLARLSPGMLHRLPAEGERSGKIRESMAPPDGLAAPWSAEASNILCGDLLGLRLWHLYGRARSSMHFLRMSGRSTYRLSKQKRKSTVITTGSQRPRSPITVSQRVASHRSVSQARRSSPDREIGRASLGIRWGVHDRPGDESPRSSRQRRSHHSSTVSHTKPERRIYRMAPKAKLSLDIGLAVKRGLDLDHRERRCTCGHLAVDHHRGPGNVRGACTGYPDPSCSCERYQWCP